MKKIMIIAAAALLAGSAKAQTIYDLSLIHI